MSGRPADPLLFATSNPHKLEEVRAILALEGVEVVGLDTRDPVPAPEENGSSFEANARIKAMAYARAYRRSCLADDSGLEVDVLGGAPGIRSARYAGRGRTRNERDAANNARLLNELEGMPDGQRTARFVCAMCFVDAEGVVVAETRGTFEGLITDHPRGTNGFGYDPLLLLPGENRTAAELEPHEKNARSHRAAAARKMAAALTR